LKNYAIIVAGGSGTRMGSTTPKQFLLVNEKPVLYYTIKAFSDSFPAIEIILVLPENQMELGKEIIDGYFKEANIRMTAGGETRFHSVKKGLSLIEEESIVFIHDGVRCLVTKELLIRCYNKALETGSAIPVSACRDSLRLITEDGHVVLDRSAVRLVQTPQTFHSKLILPAYAIDYKDRFTDEATVAEAFGIEVTLVEGDPENIKITTPLDLTVAESILQLRTL
jgi:2-C-methyl-D-erythritol 4-phosphate cytidylyltransferase